jgi:hypothetical protein
MRYSTETIRQYMILISYIIFLSIKTKAPKSPIQKQDQIIEKRFHLYLIYSNNMYH